MHEDMLKDAYDILAWLCMILSRLSEEVKQRAMRQYQSNKQKYSKEIQKQFDFLNAKRVRTEVLYDFMANSERNRLKEQIEQWETAESELPFLVALLEYLDRYLDLEKGVEHFARALLPERNQQGFYGFSALNQNEKTVQGRLIPKLSAIWEKKNARTVESMRDDPLAVMRNYLWVPYTDPNWEIRQIYVTPETLSLKENEILRIVLSPMTTRCPFHAVGTYDEKKQENIFQIQYKVEEQEGLKDVSNRTLDYAAEQQAQIVLFPEMMVSKELYHAMQEHLEEMELLAPELVCTPSSEYQIQPDELLYQNTTHILTATGGEVFEYHKQHSFQFMGDMRQIGTDLVEHVELEEPRQETKYYEPIKADRKTVVFHVQGIGRIGVFICADVFSEELGNLLFKQLKLNLLLVLSYSAGIDLFFRHLSEAQTSSTDVVWCNSCCAYGKPSSQNVIAAYFTYGHNIYNGKNKQLEETPYKCYSCGTDAGSCSGCAVVVDVASSYNGIGKIAREELA